MIKNKNSKKFKGDFQFNDSHIQFFERGTAEYEVDHIEQIYLDNEFIQQAMDFNSSRTFFIARTGVGKSAIIEKIKKTVSSEYIVQIDPESFIPSLIQSGSYLTLLQTHDISIEYFLKTLWRFIIVAELLKRRHGGQKRSFLDVFSKKNETADRARKFLDRHSMLSADISFGERVLSFVGDLRSKIEALGIKLELSAGGFEQNKKEQILNTIREFEFSEINTLVKQLDELIDGESYYLLIDDLDKAVLESGLGTELIKSLFLALIDVANLKKVKAVVSLRTNLFTQLKFNQPEKLKSFICIVSWSDNDLRRMLDRRFNYLFKIDTNFLWGNVFPNEIHNEKERLSIHRYLMRMSNRRPRDLFLLISSAMRYAKGKSRVSQEAFKKCEAEFSEDRLKNLIAEWENPFIGLEELLAYFQGKNAVMSGQELRKIIDSIIVHVDSNKKFEWLYKGSYLSTDIRNFDDPNGIFSLLFKIGVIGFKDFDNKVRFCYDYESAPNNIKLTDNLTIFVNPAFAHALTKTTAIYDQSPDIEDTSISHLV